MTDHAPMERRRFLQACSALGLALAWEGVEGMGRQLPAATRGGRGPGDPPPYPNETVERLVTQRLGGRPVRTGHVTLDMPEMAEDGRYVPVVVESDLPATPERYVKGLYLVVDYNPDPLVTVFHFTPALGPLLVQTRIKMKRSTWVRAIVETSDGELWADYRQVETTLNGCG